MSSLLFMISFLLHIILIAVVYHLFQQLKELKTDRNRQMEKLLAEFIDEVKLENEQLQQRIQKQRQPISIKKQTASPHPKIDTMKRHKPDMMDSIQRVEVDDSVETSVEAQIFQMNADGKSIEEIAKHVNRGKTEVELMIKLQGNK